MVTRAYTRRGDKGETDLFDGSRIKKTSARIAATGAVDELNSYLGVCWAHASKMTKQIIENAQKELFILGSDLATPLGAEAEGPRITEKHTKDMEKVIDEINVRLPTLRRFILPMGSEASAHLQYARSLARRAERKMLLLSEHEKINPHIIPYMNRLSSLLFVLARQENRLKKVKEKEWVS
jgi:cob(I)alamin adenosyltransferase